MKSFATGIEHLLAELQYLDLLLQRQVMRLRAANQLIEHEMRGLYISEAQVDALLSQHSHGWFHTPSHGDEAKEYHALTEEITRVRQENDDRIRASQDLPLPQLATLFGLSPFECEVLLVCIAPELEQRYETLYAYVQNDVTKKRPTVDLVLKLLCQDIKERMDHRQVFDSSARLLRDRVIWLFNDPQDQETTLLGRSMKVDRRIVDFLLAYPTIDQRLSPFTRLQDPKQQLDDLALPEELRLQLRQAAQLRETENPIFFFHGPYGVGKQAAAEAVCTSFKRKLLIADMSQLPQADRDLPTIFAPLRREAILQEAGLYLAHCETFLSEDGAATIQRQALVRELAATPFPIFLGSELSWHPVGVWSGRRFIDFAFPIPDFPLRLSIWQRALGEQQQAAILDEDVTMLANQFVLSSRQIQDAVHEASNRATLRPTDQSALSKEDLYAAARAQSNQRLQQLAQKVALTYSWADIVLPPRPLQQLHEVCTSVTYRHIVFTQWGFERKLALGKGVNVLLCGPSGTGKTMAAGIIAHELQRDLYKIDLANVVSKYIGETEKNLSRIFYEAQTSNAILFFDEADALFGKRSEVKDAHDRYANIEVAYLVQKMEEYTGIVILATNLSKNLDDAFARRIQHTIEFPFPDATSRERIWRGVFPEEVPLAEDVDLSFLARQFELAGGNIRNVALAGAFMAAEEGSAIRMEHLVVATARELQKIGKMPSQANFRQYYELVRQKA